MIRGAKTLSLRVERLKSGNWLEDREMQRRIDARRFPTIDGRVTQLQRSDGDGGYHVRGDLTFRGVTRATDGDITITPIDERTIGIKGEAVFDVRDFGMEPPRILMLRVHPDVRVSIDVVAERDET